MIHGKSKITLVGAGPGSADLISLRGIKALETADVVLYDALVNKELLHYAPQAMRKIYVGKRTKQHIYTQDQINKMLVDYARAYGHVVRLKGGDPFVFGRGYEEMHYAQSAGVHVEMVPGISSAIGVPALQGIPITHRGITESFWVITGTTSAGTLSNDIYMAAKTTTTVVILMGVHKLAEIVSLFQDAGKGDTPIALIQNGTLPDERIIASDINHIVGEADPYGMGAPAVIVIGEVVALRALYKRYLVEHAHAGA